MTPDYKKAAAKAVETAARFNSDALSILKSLNNVHLIAYSINRISEAGFYCSEEMFNGQNQDAFTLANKKDGKLQYIIIYNQTVSPVKLRYALSRELGHVMLEHDGSSAEEIWSEEANCFSYHFLCPLPLMENKPKSINFKPKCSSILWGMKNIRTFDSIDHMKLYVADQKNRINRFVGSKNQYEPDDVELTKAAEYDRLTGWKNCFDVVLDGQTLGYCGE